MPPPPPLRSTLTVPDAVLDTAPPVLSTALKTGPPVPAKKDGRRGALALLDAVVTDTNTDALALLTDAPSFKVDSSTRVNLRLCVPAGSEASWEPTSMLRLGAAPPSTPLALRAREGLEGSSLVEGKQRRGKQRREREREYSMVPRRVAAKRYKQCLQRRHV